MAGRRCGLKLLPIRDLNDPLLLPWLDLYETAFPPRERLLVSAILSMVTTGAAGEGPQLLAAVDDNKAFAGMAMLGRPLDGSVGHLWFFAVEPQLRNHSVGATLYRQILQDLRESGCRALFLEVEIPDLAETPEGRALAERRIGFYRRFGARRLTGIDYLQRVGWHQEPLPMYLMVQLLAELTAQDALALAYGVFGTDLTVIGDPGLG